MTGDSLLETFPYNTNKRIEIIKAIKYKPFNHKVVVKLLAKPSVNILIPPPVRQKTWQASVGFTSSLINFHVCFKSQEI